MLKQTHLDTVGDGEHRSGWPYCMQSLKPIFSDKSPILFDDFCERTFLYDRKWHEDYTYTEPWVATFHHPPDIPDWYFKELHLQRLLEHSRWVESLPHLRLILSMGPNLTEWCNSNFPDIPVATIQHPTGEPLVYWTPDRFLSNKRKRIIQVGWFLRNIRAIYQAHVPPWLIKTHLWQSLSWIDYANRICKDNYAKTHPERRDIGDTYQYPSLPDTQYDLFLAENIVFVEVISAVANNTVVECISRNTPICINRHPGPEYYLGKNYPLFYDHIDDVYKLLTIDNIVAAHEYLKTMDKWWIQGRMFCEQVKDACTKHIPECREFTDEVTSGNLTVPDDY